MGIMRIIIFLVIVSLFSACGGGSSSNNNQGTGDATADTVTDVKSITDITTDVIIAYWDDLPDMPVAMRLGTKADEQTPLPSRTVDCPGGGKAIITGYYLPFPDGNYGFSLTIQLIDCNGLNGTFDTNGMYYKCEETGDVIISTNFNGTITGLGCSIDLSQFSYGVSFNTNGEAKDEKANGTASATCSEIKGDAQVECQPSNIAPSDTNALKSSCSCTGSGCTGN